MIDFGQLSELERHACALVRQYRFLLPREVKEFMIRLADSLDWHQLTRELK